jgi:aspartate carbamoyltransferase catalytic subunit
MKDGTLGRLYGKSLLLTDDYSAEELDAVVSVTERLAALDRAGRKAALLSDELAYTLFFDNSTNGRRETNRPSR